MLTREPVNRPFVPAIVRARGLWNAAFANDDQQDAHEAFTSILESCDTVDRRKVQELAGDVLEAANNIDFSATFAWKCFGRNELVSFRCLQCGKHRETMDSLNCLQLPLPGEGPFTLESLLDRYEAEEALLDDDDVCKDVDENTGHDSGCGGTRCQTRKLTISTLPEILVIQFRRFQFEASTLRFAKINDHVRFGPTLQRGADRAFTLKGVLVHSGSLHVGHYTAYVRDDDANWFFCDDANAPQFVSDTDRVFAQQAYMLFYEQ